jgi:hypothetical protein
VHDTTNVPQLAGDVAAVSADLVSGGCRIASDELWNVGRLGEDVGSVAELGDFGYHAPRKVKYVFIPEKEDVQAAPLQLLIEERVVIRFPTKLGDVEVGGNPELAAQLR